MRSLLGEQYPLPTMVLTDLYRLQEETAKVEEHLLDNHSTKPSFTDAIVKCLTYSKANAFENILEPLQKLLRLSPPIASTLARPDLFTKIGQKLHHSKAAVRLNLLRIISSICDSNEEQGGLLAGYGLLDAIRELENDSAILVRDMAGKLIRSSERSEAYGLAKRRPGIRRQSTSATPPSFLANQSAPSTPQINRSSQSKGYFDGRDSPRQPRNSLNGSALALRPGSRDGSSPAANGGSIASRSRLPRGNRFHHAELPEEEDPGQPAPLSRRPSVLPRLRRRTLADPEWT